MEGAQAFKSPVAAVSLHEERTSHEDDNDYLSAGEDHDDDRSEAVSLHDDTSSPVATPIISSEDEDKSAAAAVSKAEDVAHPAEVLVQPSKDVHEESSFEDKASPAEVLAKPPSKNDGVESSSFEDRASPPKVLAKPSKDDGVESSSFEDRASPPKVLAKPSKDDHVKSSSFEDRASPPKVLAKPSKDDHDESSSLENRPSPAVALMSSEHENESATAAKESSSNTNIEFHSEQLASPSQGGARETEAPPPPQSLGMAADSILMVAEAGDPHGGGVNNYGVTSLAKSKSLGVSEARGAEDGGERNEQSEMKIVARPSADDDFTPAVSSPLHRRCVSVDLVAKVPANYSPSPSPSPKPLDSSQKLNKVQIDTAAPIKSVKAAVSKFGGIVDWKAHRVHTVERRKYIEQELEKAQEEMPACKQQCEVANEARIQALKQLESTKRLIEELKLNLERAQTEEQQAKQDSELAKLRVEEMEQGIADEASFAAKAQLEVAKARHAAAVSELKSVGDELEQLRTDYDLLVAEKDAAETKAEEAMFSSKEVEKSVENLTIELITLKQSLDSAHSAHLEAEEHRIGAVMAKEQDNLNWEVELKQAEEELDKLNLQMITTKDLKSKLDEASTLLQDLKAELAAYMESKSDEEASEDPLKEPETKTRADIETAINAAKRELLDVKDKIEKATKEVNILKVASASLRSQLEKENLELQAIQQREGMASVAAASLEAELNRIKSEIDIIQMKEQEEREKLVELPLQLQKAGQEAEQAKELARIASEDLEKAKLEADEAKAVVSEREGKLRAVEKEIEAAKASERLALEAITALKESESAQRNVDDDSSFGITLTLEEYYELSKRAHEAEEQANARVAAAMSQIEIAKEAEQKSSDKLEVVSKEMSQRKDSLEAALQNAAQAEERKMSVEQELRKWRADHEQKRKNSDSAASSANTGKSSKDDGKDSKNQKSPKSSKGGGDDGKSGKKKKKSFFPRFFMFLGKGRKSHSSKQEGS